MSLFGALMGDLDDDPIFGHHMRSMRQMNNFMNSFMGDAFSMLSPFDGFGGRQSALTGANQRNSSLMPFGFQSMPNINRLLTGDIGESSSSFCSSSFVTMTPGPDGRPQVYQETSSLKTGPGGIRETRKTVQDSRTGLKKMAIGHHIGDRAHIIEREKNLRSGEQEERQDFINIDEDDAEDFDKEFISKAKRHAPAAAIESGNPSGRRQLPAIMAPPSSASTPSCTSPRRPPRNITKVASRRPLRTPSSSPLALPSSSHSSSSTSIHPHPYNPSAARRNFRSKKLSNSTNISPDKK